MNLIWLMLLMPTSAAEQVTVFPKSFATKEACLSLGQVLIVEREFRCILQERQTRVVIRGEEGDRPLLVLAPALG